MIVNSFTSCVSAAEKEAVSLDILVCGHCQSVFHFVEEFSEHKKKDDCEKADRASVHAQVHICRFLLSCQNVVIFKQCVLFECVKLFVSTEQQQQTSNLGIFDLEKFTTTKTTNET